MKVWIYLNYSSEVFKHITVYLEYIFQKYNLPNYFYNSFTYK